MYCEPIDLDVSEREPMSQPGPMLHEPPVGRVALTAAPARHASGGRRSAAQGAAEPMSEEIELEKGMGMIKQFA